MKWHQLLLQSDMPDIEADGFLQAILDRFHEVNQAVHAGVYFHQQLASGAHLFYFPPRSIPFHVDTLRRYKSIELEFPPNVENMRHVDLSIPGANNQPDPPLNPDPARIRLRAFLLPDSSDPLDIPVQAGPVSFIR